MIDQFQKIIRLGYYIRGLDGLFLDCEQIISNILWRDFYEKNSKLVQNDLGSLNQFKDVKYEPYLEFCYYFIKFFVILKEKMFDHFYVFENLPDLLKYIKENPRLGLESCLKKMIPYMRKFLKPLFQQCVNSYEQQTGKEFSYEWDIPDLSYFI